MLAVADRADHGHELARRDVGLRADRLHALDDRGDLRLGRPLFHHDHHLSLSLSKLVAGVAICGAASGDAERLAKSEVPARESRWGESLRMFVAGSDQLVQRCEEAVVLVAVP